MAETRINREKTAVHTDSTDDCTILICKQSSGSSVLFFLARLKKAGHGTAATYLVWLQEGIQNRKAAHVN